jgi:hypothetical protein
MTSLSYRQTLPIRIEGIFPSLDNLHIVIWCNFKYLANSLVVIICAKIDSPYRFHFTRPAILELIFSRAESPLGNVAPQIAPLRRYPERDWAPLWAVTVRLFRAFPYRLSPQNQNPLNIEPVCLIIPPGGFDQSGSTILKLNQSVAFLFTKIAVFAENRRPADCWCQLVYRILVHDWRFWPINRLSVNVPYLTHRTYIFHFKSSHTACAVSLLMNWCLLNFYFFKPIGHIFGNPADGFLFTGNYGPTLPYYIEAISKNKRHFFLRGYW